MESLSNQILFARGNNSVIIPTKREEDGAFDIYANFEESYIAIQPHETKMIPTGLHSAFSSDYVAILKERGSTGSKGIGQRCGVVDSGYRGQWFVPLTNHNNKPLVIVRAGFDLEEELHDEGSFGENYILYPYEKAIAQCIMIPIPKLSVKEVSIEDLIKFKSDRMEGALGSSGK